MRYRDVDGGGASAVSSNVYGTTLVSAQNARKMPPTDSSAALSASQDGYYQFRQQGYDRSIEQEKTPGNKVIIRQSIISSTGSEKRGKFFGLSVGGWSILAGVFILIVGLAVIGFFFWPRYPTVTVKLTQLADSPPASTLPIIQGGVFFNASVGVVVVVNNPNKYDLKLASLTMTTKLVVPPADLTSPQFTGHPALAIPNPSPQPLGTLNLNSVVATAGSTTEFSTVMLINYYATPNGWDDAGLAELISGCGVLSSTQQHLMTATFFSSIQMDGFLSSFGFSPTSSGQFMFACPPSLGPKIRQTYSSILMP
eukprot:jgi/Hompol1/612/HPOL_005385-RA